MIHLRLLGPTELRGADGGSIVSVLSQPKRLALLAYLATQATGAFVRRDKLLALFWPESDEEKARASLRRSLSFLRQSLGPDVVVTRGDHEVGLSEDSLACDVATFDAAVEASEREKAMDLYGGPFLDGLLVFGASPVNEWIEAERRRLGIWAYDCASALADGVAAEDPGSALTWARRALALEPLNEPAAARVIRLLHEVGDRDGALRAYDDFASRLLEDLELEPPADLQGLVEVIRGSGPYPGPPVEAGRIGTIEGSAAVGAGATEAAGSVEVTPLDRNAATGVAAGVTHASLTRTHFLRRATTALAAVIVGLALWGSLRPSTPETVVRYSMAMAQGEEMPPLAGRRIALSPDGSTLVYVGQADRQLRVRRRDQLFAPPLPGTDGALSPFFSPDGRQVGFFSQGRVKVTPVEGGAITVVTDGLDFLDGVSWSDDGFLYGRPRGFSPLVRLTPTAGAVPEPFTLLDVDTGETDHQWPDALPDGRGVLFSILRAGIAGTEYLIAVTDGQSGTHKILTEGIFARYAASGHLLFVAPDSTLMVAPFDLDDLELTGPATAVGNAQRVGFRRAVDVAVSQSGTLVYATGPGRQTRELVWVDRDGTVEPFDSTWHQALGFPRLSPDESRLAVTIGDQESASVWVRDLATGGLFQLSPRDAASGYPAWAPDGESVSYYSSVAGQVDLWIQRADGSARASLLLTRPRDLAESTWTPDGDWLIYRTSNVPRFQGAGGGAGSRGASDILAIRPGIDAEPLPLLSGEFSELAPAVSPDGKWLAYASSQGGRDEVFVVPFPSTSDARWPITPDGGTEPIWIEATGELIYRDPRRAVWALEVQTSPTFAIGARRLLFEGDYVISGLHASYDVTRDGQRFLMVREVGVRDPGELIVVENWFRELEDLPGLQ